MCFLNRTFDRDGELGGKQIKHFPAIKFSGAEFLHDLAAKPVEGLVRVIETTAGPVDRRWNRDMNEKIFVGRERAFGVRDVRRRKNECAGFDRHDIVAEQKLDVARSVVNQFPHGVLVKGEILSFGRFIRSRSHYAQLRFWRFVQISYCGVHRRIPGFFIN